MWHNRYNHKYTKVKNWNVVLLTLALIVVVVMGSSCSSAAKTTPATTTKTTTTPVTVATTTTITTSKSPTTATTSTTVATTTTTTTTTSKPPTTATTSTTVATTTTTTTTTSKPPTTATTSASTDKPTHLVVDIEQLMTSGFKLVWLRPLNDMGSIKIVTGTVAAKLWLMKPTGNELVHSWSNITLNADNYTLLSKGAEIELPYPTDKEYDYDEPGIFQVTLTLTDKTVLVAELKNISLHPTAIT
jgi:hypothetical protein